MSLAAIEQISREKKGEVWTPSLLCFPIIESCDPTTQKGGLFL